jgi:archaemetzincin
VAYLGVTGADVYAGDMNFLFGLGSFRERAGVYSLTRYYPQFWNQPGTEKAHKLTLRRACQVLNHEAGHMLGLMHCVLYKCSMNGSNSLMDADATPIEPCPVCHRKLAWNLNWDEAKRNRELTAFYRKYGLEDMVRRG